MPSPFPGMNPYLEQKDVWEDFHHRLLTAAADALATQVDPNYIVKLAEQLYIHELDPSQYRLIGKPDVSLSARHASPLAASMTAFEEAPAQIRLIETVDTVTHAYLEILDRKGREVVTVLEVLSPSNKPPGPDREQYCNKRVRILRRWVNLVEIDLLRGWPRMPADSIPPCDYCVIVSPYDKRPYASLWPLSLGDKLPTIPIPLRSPDPDAKLDLQAILNQVYDAAHYQTYVYDAQPEPRLTPDQQEWAKQFLPPPRQ